MTFDRSIWHTFCSSATETCYNHSKSAGHCLPGAPRLRRWSALSFYELAVIAFQAIRLFFYVFRGPKYPHDLPHQIHFSESGFSLKNVLFWSLCSRPKKQKNNSQGNNKNTKIRSRNSLKSIVAILSMRKQRCGSTRRRKSESEIDNKMRWKPA